jgi:L-asparaginase
MKKDKIIFILTGGTIDSRYDGMKDTPMVKNSSGIKNYLDKNIQPIFEYDYQIATFKDSRDITEEDRKNILKMIQECPSDSKIIITHGTYTMPDTARFIKENIQNLDSKTIVFTGAMIPLEGFSETDASFNIGFAIASAQMADSGIYIAMNGHLFEADKVKKNLEEGRFEES